MENCIKRFPVVGVMIFKNLDDQSLVTSKIASPEIAEFVENEKFYLKRKMKKYNGKFEGFEESWNQVFNKTQTDVIKQLFVAAQQYFKENPFKSLKSLKTPST